MCESRAEKFGCAPSGEAVEMSDDFHVLPTLKLKQAAKNCPLLERNSEAWIACCSRRFFPLARRIAGDDSLAEDVLQTSWIKIIQSVKHARFEGPKACPWVRTIVANTAENVRRQREQRGEVAFCEEIDLHPDPEALARNKELTALLAEMIQMLPGTYRQILELRLYQDLSTRQTAERLHISRSSVSTRLSRAVRLLQGRLDARLRSSSAEDFPQS